MTSRQGFFTPPRRFAYCESCDRPFDASAVAGPLCLRCRYHQRGPRPTPTAPRYEYVPGDLPSDLIEAIIAGHLAQLKHARITRLNRECGSFV